MRGTLVLSSISWTTRMLLSSNRAVSFPTFLPVPQVCRLTAPGSSLKRIRGIHG